MGVETEQLQIMTCHFPIGRSCLHVGGGDDVGGDVGGDVAIIWNQSSASGNTLIFVLNCSSMSNLLLINCPEIWRIFFLSNSLYKIKILHRTQKI